MQALQSLLSCLTKFIKQQTKGKDMKKVKETKRVGGFMGESGGSEHFSEKRVKGLK